VLQTGAFVPENASIPALADYDVLSVFEGKPGPRSPRFLVAGAPKRYRLDPAHLTVGGTDCRRQCTRARCYRRFARQAPVFCWAPSVASETESLWGGQGYPPGLKFYGIVGGYRGLDSLKDVDDKRWVTELHPRVTDAWAVRSCSSLHALRTKDYKVGSEDFQAFIDRLAQTFAARNWIVL